VIPVTVIDAPTQRFYAAAVYVALLCWKLYDWIHVVENHEVSLALLVKWSIIDFIYLFGLPEMRIPWLELSQQAVLILYAGHFIMNYMLMFDIPVSRTFYPSRQVSLKHAHHGSLLVAFPRLALGCRQSLLRQGNGSL